MMQVKQALQRAFGGHKQGRGINCRTILLMKHGASTRPEASLVLFYLYFN